MQSVQFEVITKDKKTKARTGLLKTPHGEVHTPILIPVATQASVKALTPKDLNEIGAEIVLANTYHLYLRPGEEIVAESGGLASFMDWNKPTMTDSGGYQVFSLGAAQEANDEKRLNKFTSADEIKKHKIEAARLSRDEIGLQKLKPAKIDDTGVTFYSHLDGSKHRLDSEKSIKIQEKLGADLIVAFDDHESPLWDYEETKKSLERTNRWALESLKAHTRSDQLMYGVTHGGLFQDLREESAEFTDKHFNAIAIGGTYSSKETLYKVIEWTVAKVDPLKQKHLLGIGEVADLFEAVERGIDFFDCVAPTRRARHGNVYIQPQNGGSKENDFTTQITNEKFVKDLGPLDLGCKCYTCQNFSRAYLNHLFRAKEILGLTLATHHNVYFVINLMKQMRESIEIGKFLELKGKWLK